MVYADETIPLHIVQQLRAKGYRVASVPRSMPDTAILARALAEYDSDFLRPVLDEGKPDAGLIIVRMSFRVPVEDEAQMIVELLRRYKGSFLEHAGFFQRTEQISSILSLEEWQENQPFHALSSVLDMGDQRAFPSLNQMSRFLRLCVNTGSGGDAPASRFPALRSQREDGTGLEMSVSLLTRAVGPHVPGTIIGLCLSASG
jgi:hypothetical protein